jgi:hypothetical protein
MERSCRAATGSGKKNGLTPHEAPLKIKRRKINRKIDQGSVMTSRYLVIIVLILLLVPVAAFDILEEKPKTQWGFRDFYSAAQEAANEAERYRSDVNNRDLGKAAEADKTALENYLKAEEIVAQEKDDSPDKWYFIGHIEQAKYDIYRSQGKTAEADKALAAMGVASGKYEELTKNQGSGLGCLVVTATYGSPMAAEVQLVRNFRDQSIIKSYSGSRFMPGFNAWYYSFSPQVSGYISDHPVVKPAMRVLLTPLIEIVFLSQWCYSMLSFSPELATFSALIAGGALYGLVYVFPVVFIGHAVAKRRGWKGADAVSMKPVLLVWAMIAVLLVAGTVFSLDLFTTVTSGLLVIVTIVLVAGTLSFSLSRYVSPKTLVQTV